MSSLAVHLKIKKAGEPEGAGRIKGEMLEEVSLAAKAAPESVGRFLRGISGEGRIK